VTDLEFDILDELYFVISFHELSDRLTIDEALLKSELLSLIQKGWVKILKPFSDEEVETWEQYGNLYKEYFYLATKKGLLVHNLKS
jgi:hypothetical protein